VYDGAFAFEFAQGDTIARDGSELHVGGGSNRGNAIPQGSGTANAVAAAVSEPPQRDTAGRDNGPSHGQSQPDLHTSDNGSGAKEHVEHEAPGDDLNHGQSQKVAHDSGNGSDATKGRAKHEAPADDLNRGQSQKVVHDSGNGSDAPKGHAKHEAPAGELNHGQSQKALHGSDNGSGALKAHAKHEASGGDSNHGQALCDLQTFEEGSAASKQHAKHDPQPNKPQHDLQTASVNSANDEHSALKVKAGGKDGASSDGATSAVGTKLGDSFHFKNGANNASSDILELQQLGHGSGTAHGDGQYATADRGPVPVQDADAIDLSAGQHDHSGHADHHAAHDLIV
jgi:hypothetical protein